MATEPASRLPACPLFLTGLNVPDVPHFYLQFPGGLAGACREGVGVVVKLMSLDVSEDLEDRVGRGGGAAPELRVGREPGGADLPLDESGEEQGDEVLKKMVSIHGWS